MSDAPPDLLALIQRGLVRKPTADVLLARLESVPDRKPAALSEAAFATLVALCARLRPHTFRPTAQEIALGIDDRLAAGKGDGWRYDALPGDREAFETGLRAFDAETKGLDGETMDDVIRALQKGETRTEWPFSASRFLEDVLAEVVGLAYSHPSVQSAIDYVGYADAAGWKAIGPNEREAWER